VDELIGLAKANPSGVSISSETATGKSTAFVASLAYRTTGAIWLLVPRIVLRDEYQNPWLTMDTIVKLSRGVPDDGSRVKVMTYGHYLARVRAGTGPEDSDFVLMDEFGEREPDMGLAYHATGGVKFLLSATPNLLYAPHATVKVVPIPRPFEEPTPIRLGLPVVGLIQEALREHPGEQRLLVIVPGIPEAASTAQALRDLGRVATAVSSKARSIPKIGDIVATQIVDSGVDIPGITIVIDKGLRVVQDKGKTLVLPTDPSVDKQRRGRTGRRNLGFVYTSLVAGTGEHPLPYPTYTRIMEEVSAREWLFATLGIQDSTEVYSYFDASRIDPRMSFKTGEILTTNEKTSLAGWWCLACSGIPTHQVDQAYDDIVTRGWSEKDDAISQMLNRAYGQVGLLPRTRIARLLASRPFAVRMNGQEYRPLAMRIEDGCVYAV
jgi:hypothetical protein